MADPYFLDRTNTSGYKPTRVSNEFHLQNAAVSGGSHGGLLQTPPRFFSVPSIHSHQLLPFIQQQQQQQQPPPLLTPPPILRPHRTLSSQPRSSHSLKKSKSIKRDKDSPAVVDRRVPSRTFSSPAAAKRVVRVEEFDKLSGCLFAVISPPPSSLPLPKFCLRPAKLNCNA